MKSITLIIFLLVANLAMAQKVKSQFGQDSITLCPQCLEIHGIGVTAKNDTARSVYWFLGGFGRDLAPGFTLTTNYYDRSGNFLTYVNAPVLGAQLPNLALIKLKIDSLMKVTQPRIITTP